MQSIKVESQHEHAVARERMNRPQVRAVCAQTRGGQQRYPAMPGMARSRTTSTTFDQVRPRTQVEHGRVCTNVPLTPVAVPRCRATHTAKRHAKEHEVLEEWNKTRDSLGLTSCVGRLAPAFPTEVSPPRRRLKQSRRRHEPKQHRI